MTTIRKYVSKAKEKLSLGPPAVKLCFFHMPKCSGNSFYRYLNKIYGEEFRDLKLKSVRDGTWNSEDSEWDNYFRSAYHQEFMLRYLSRDGSRCITGHFTTSPETIDYVKQQFSIVSILRESG